MAEQPIYTVGHSTRTIPEFLDLLRAGEVTPAKLTPGAVEAEDGLHYPDA